MRSKRASLLLKEEKVLSCWKCGITQHQLKSAFAQSPWCIALGLIAWTMTSAPGIAQTMKSELDFPAINHPEYRGLKSEIAQLQDTGTEDKRSELIRLANSYQDAGKFAEAEDAFRNLIKKYPKDPVLEYKLAKALFSQDKLEDAVAAYQQAIKFDSSYVLAYDGLGIALAKQGRIDEAIASFRQALVINPNYVDALTHLGEVLWYQGKRTEAQATLEKALPVLKQQGRFQDARRVEQLLQKIRTAQPEPV